MTDKEKKQNFLDCYRDSYGNLSEALDKSGIKSSDYLKFIELPDFKREIEAVQQLRDDLIDSKFLGLVKNGDVRAVIEAKKMLAEKRDGIDIADIKRKSMIYLITHADTKGECLTAFCDWFPISEKGAEKYYQKIIIEEKLKGKTPFERAELKRKEKESSLADQFNKGNLTRMEMFKGIITLALDIVETAQYPSEKMTASKTVLEYERRIQELKDEEEKKNKLTMTDLFERIDSAVFDVPVEKIHELEEKHNLLEAPAFLEG